MFGSRDSQRQTSTAGVPLVPLSARTSQQSYSPKDERNPPPKGWPSGPRQCRPTVSDIVAELACDVVFIALSMLFLVFGFIVKTHDQAPVAQHGLLTQRLLEATKYGPTIFPILYAAVVGRAVKGFLSWRLERGERLGVLDLLAGSSTLVNAVTTQLTLRIASVAGPLLVVLWALSPLGGQASLRVMTVGNTTISRPDSFQYMVQNRSFAPFDTADDASEIAVIDGIFVASLLSPWKTKLSTVDTWGNVKIPMIEALENSLTSDSDGWYTPVATEMVYSSLIGTPIASIQDTDINTTLTIETSYWRLECPVLANADQPPNTNISESPWAAANGMSGTLASNTTYPRVMPSNETQLLAEESTPIPDDLSPRTIVYNTWDNDANYTKTGSICQIYTTYVEAEVSCAGLTCAASQLRRSTLPHPPAAWTFFDAGSFTWGHFASIFVALINGHSATATGVQLYFVDPQSPFDVNFDKALSTLAPQVYATRFAQLLNSVWAATVGMYAIPDGISAETASQDETTLEETYVAKYANATGTAIRSVEVIQCHNGWLAALSAASLVMVVASLAAPLLRALKHAPDFTLNVSTMVRDNPYVGLPATGSTLTSAERARLAKHMRVRFGDVAAEDEVGHIAVGSVGAGHHVARARKGRLYE
ncbi:hypothetical protein LTR36_010421 [Oleoguttula mirabilis]|uniref:Uncharacterized protein n=1 Tax=Oleoguttula mirabilis TaxID=1507867 RepID=A0AAV9J4Y5_9PEZI|nr:hypothetical protein LTR36_010421 [Oleoguttula mirabilis]